MEGTRRSPVRKRPMFLHLPVVNVEVTLKLRWGSRYAGWDSKRAPAE